jgi:hypothetical protein
MGDDDPKVPESSGTETRTTESEFAKRSTFVEPTPPPVAAAPDSVPDPVAFAPTPPPANDGGGKTGDSPTGD